jgi:hypothetical protein
MLNARSHHGSREWRPRRDIVDLRSEELMNLETTSRPQPDRRCCIGGSCGHLIVSANEAELILLCKEEHGEVESKGHRARSRVRIAAARRKSTSPRLHPVSSVVCWLFKPFVFFLNLGSCSQTPTPNPVSWIKAASITDRNLSTVLSRKARCLKAVSSRMLRAQGRRCCSQDRHVPRGPESGHVVKSSLKIS